MPGDKGWQELASGDVLEQLADLFIARGLQEYIRSNNGPEFAAKALKG